MNFLQFHWYGLVVGIAIVSGVLVTERFTKNWFSEKVFYQLSLLVLLSGVVGARFWHVVTDFHLYQDNIWQVFFIWLGGLSILGAITGGMIGFYFAAKKLTINKKIFLDGVAFGLPIAQFIGRWANFLNQELYGLPTQLFWGIYIKPENRPVVFLDNDYFHPLFLYEGLLALVGWLMLFLLKKLQIFEFGKGDFFIFYLVFYVLVRFFLDFLRVDRSFVWLGLGINQWFIFLVGFLVVVCWIMKQCKKTKS